MVQHSITITDNVSSDVIYLEVRNTTTTSVTDLDGIMGYGVASGQYSAGGNTAYKFVRVSKTDTNKIQITDPSGLSKQYTSNQVTIVDTPTSVSI